MEKHKLRVEAADDWRLCSETEGHIGCCREFAEVLEVVRGEKGKVVAVTSPERAQAVNETERPGFFNEIHKVL